jgi:aminoglycoside N3'-acetyltransferase
MHSSFRNFLDAIGVGKDDAIVVHGSFRAVKRAFPGIAPLDVFDAVADAVGEDGAVLAPAFTYCFKKKRGESSVFDRERSPAVVGALAEAFRTRPGTLRTSAPTHSFSLFGRVAEEVGEENAPISPLGFGSPMDWLVDQPRAFALLLGVGFDGFSFVHYLESYYDAPYVGVNPWEDIVDPPVGLSVAGEQPLEEAPGCSKSFPKLERWLIDRASFRPRVAEGLRVSLVPIDRLVEDSREFFETRPLDLLCPREECAPCRVRRDTLAASK